MSLLTKASLVITPNAYEEGKLFSVIPNTSLGDMDVTRATTATRVNAQGFIEVVPRNLLSYSNDFSNASWLKDGITVIPNSVISPDGTTNASKIQETTGTITYGIYKQNPITIGNYSTNTFYAKSAGRNWIAFNAIDGASNFCWFNLSNGTLGTVSPTLTASITPSENGFYKITVTTLSFGASQYFSIIPTTGNNVSTYTGDGTSGFYLYGCQRELGNVSTEYFQTTTRLNIPRIDYSNGSCPAVLVEPQRTNLLLQSNVFNSVSWSKYGTPIINSGILSPDGTNNAFELNMSVGQGIYQNATNNAGTYACSIYIKGDINGIIGLIDGNSLPTQTVNVTTQWKKVNVVITKGSSALQYAIYRLDLSHLAKVYIYGAQCELGTYPTSYIPTISTTVTRNADLISKSGISTLIGQTEGTLFLDFEKTNNDNTGIGGFFRMDLNDGTTSNRILFGFDTNQIMSTVISAGVVQCIISTTGVQTQKRIKACFAYKNNDFILYVNGVQIGIDTLGTVPVGMANFNLGVNQTTPTDTSAIINSQIFFKTRLTNTELINITTL